MYPEIKHFVQEALGCTCPEEVFNTIDYQKECDDISGRKIYVGERLLSTLLLWVVNLTSRELLARRWSRASRNAMKRDLFDSGWYLSRPTRARARW